MQVSLLTQLSESAKLDIAAADKAVLLNTNLNRVWASGL